MSGDHNGPTWQLPPLILHPFATLEDTEKLIESSRLHLALAAEERDENEEMQRRLLVCRYHEIRMLYFVGKDIFRWIEQCLDFVARDGKATTAGLVRPQHFAECLASRTPASVHRKLANWGVTDYRVLFSRSIGLRAVFAEVPEFGHLSTDFLQHYHRYADAMFTSYCQSVTFNPASPPVFDFELYASGEYARLLAEQWTQS
ncbi:MAG: hypothetical protein M1436_10490 [Acidobacteria bacterium]|nr:hypothetical protein [Acidobacteriota bacterium]